MAEYLTMTEKQAAFIRQAYREAGLEPTDENLNKIMHKIFYEMADVQWYEISRKRAYHWCSRIAAAREAQARKKQAQTYDPDRHNDE